MINTPIVYKVLYDSIDRIYTFCPWELVYVDYIVVYASTAESMQRLLILNNPKLIKITTQQLSRIAMWPVNQLGPTEDFPITRCYNILLLGVVKPDGKLDKELRVLCFLIPRYDHLFVSITVSDKNSEGTVQTSLENHQEVVGFD